jgi:hypothetical protein
MARENRFIAGGPVWLLTRFGFATLQPATGHHQQA